MIRSLRNTLEEALRAIRGELLLWPASFGPFPSFAPGKTLRLLVALLATRIAFESDRFTIGHVVTFGTFEACLMLLSASMARVTILTAPETLPKPGLRNMSFHRERSPIQI